MIAFHRFCCAVHEHVRWQFSQMPFTQISIVTLVELQSGEWTRKRFDRAWLNGSNEYRTPFHRDLDNLAFCGAFRRLQGKTQVRRTGPKWFSRKRLSHSIEVAGIARAIVSKIHLATGKEPGNCVVADLPQKLPARRCRIVYGRV